jgi:hypothetical protein
MNKKQFKFTLCNPPRCNCPDVLYDDGTIMITDDYGGKIKLSMDDLEEIVERTHNLITNIIEDVENQQDYKKAALEAKKEAILSKQKRPRSSK